MEVERKASDQSKVQTKSAESMQWEKSEDHVKGANGKNNLAPGPGMTYKPPSPLCLEAGLSPLAMSYDGEKGWTTGKIGPNSRL